VALQRRRPIFFRAGDWARPAPDVPRYTVGFTERVDIIGNQKFLDFVDDLEKLEDLKLDTFELGKDKLRIATILPIDSRKEFDIGLPCSHRLWCERRPCRRDCGLGCDGISDDPAPAVIG